MRIVLWSGGSNLAGPGNPLSAGHPSGAITKNAIMASMIGIREITSRPPCGDEICSYASQCQLLRRSHHAGPLSLGAEITRRPTNWYLEHFEVCAVWSSRPQCVTSFARRVRTSSAPEWPARAKHQELC